MINIFPIQIFLIVLCIIGLAFGGSLCCYFTQEFLKSSYEDKEEEDNNDYRNVFFIIIGIFSIIISLNFIVKIIIHS